MSILGEIFGALMTDRLKQALARQGQEDRIRGTADMRELIKALEDLNNNSEIDLCEDKPGYEEFIKASDAEYRERNFSKAKALYEKACELGHPMARCNYALWHLEGSRPGTKKNLQRAFELFQQSAEQKIGMAQYNLAHFYHSGKGGIAKKDYDRAFCLVKESIKDDRVSEMKQGEPFFLLGNMYIQGQGCMKNTIKAKKYFEKAKEFHHPGANDELLKMVNLLSQVSGVDRQRETDMRWNRMCAYNKDHPEERPETVGENLQQLNKFGFDLVNKPSEREKRIKGGFDKFMEVTGGQMHLMDEYEMEDAPKAVKTCGNCGKEAPSRRCSRCGEPYCSRPCQKADWQSHKKVCQAVQAAQAL